MNPNDVALARPARARLPAARAGDGRPDVLHEVRRGAATARCGSRRATCVATSGLGSLALSRHRFAEALALGRRAHAISPTTARNYGVIGDALVELGRYREAFAAFDTMAALQPGLSSYARDRATRASCSATSPRRDRVDEARARRRRRTGRGRAPGRTSSSASSTGRAARSPPRGASTAPRCALFPGYAYALDALAQVEAARGRPRLPRSRSSSRPSTAIPLPQFVASLGDLLPATRASAAARAGSTRSIAVIERLLRANGVRTDLETALFDVDHGIRLARVARARAAGAARAAVDRRRRRARLGARAQRPLRRGAALLEARAPARHAGRAQALPPRDDRALPRPPRRRAPWFAPRARAQPALLAALGADREEARAMKTTRPPASPRGAVARAGRRAAAHPLGNFTINRFSRVEVSGHRLYVRLRAGHGRDPDVPGAAGSTPRPTRAGSRAAPS